MTLLARSSPGPQWRTEGKGHLGHFPFLGISVLPGKREAASKDDCEGRVCEKQPDERDSREKSYSGSTGPEGRSPSCWGSHWSHCTQKSGSEQEVGQAIKPQGPPAVAPSHLLKVPQPSQTTSPASDQVFKHMNLRRGSH